MRWRNCVFAQVETDEGISGIGEGSLEYQPKAVEAAIQQLAARYAIGRSAFATEKLWHDMLRNEFMHAPIINSAAAALEMAMLDIVGKALGRPVYDLLGGRVHDVLPAYANAWYGVGKTPQEIGAAAAAARQGLSRPEVRSVRGCGPRSRQGLDPQGGRDRRGGARRDRARRRPDDRRPWPLQPGLGDRDRARARAVRSVLARGAVRPGERRLARDGRPQHQDAARDRRALHQPRRDGRTAGDPRDRRAAARHHPCRRHHGGKKIAAMADAYYIPVSFHNPFGPVATAAAVQLDACTTNFFMQESFCEYDVDFRFDLLEHAPRPENGHYVVPDRPGLGVGEFRPEVALRASVRAGRIPAAVHRPMVGALLILRIRTALHRHRLPPAQAAVRQYRRIDARHRPSPQSTSAARGRRGAGVPRRNAPRRTRCAATGSRAAS